MIQYLIQTLLIALTISLTCLAVHVTTWRGMILHRASILIENALSNILQSILSQSKAKDLSLFLLKPFYRCMICMSSIWTIIFWVKWDFNLGLMIFCVCGINTLFTAFIERILPDE